MLKTLFRTLQTVSSALYCGVILFVNVPAPAHVHTVNFQHLHIRLKISGRKIKSFVIPLICPLLLHFNSTLLNIINLILFPQKAVHKPQLIKNSHLLMIFQRYAAADHLSKLFNRPYYNYKQVLNLSLFKTGSYFIFTLYSFSYLNLS